MTSPRQVDSRAGLERIWTRRGVARGLEHRSQLDRIVIAMLRDATDYEARQDGKTPE